MTTKEVAASYWPEVRERAVRLVLEGGGDHTDAVGGDQLGIGQDRLLEPIGNIPSAEAEARYYAQANTQALTA